MASDDWTLRPLRPDDHEAAAALISAAFAEQSMPTDPPPSALRKTAAGVATMDGGAVTALPDGGLAGVALWAARDGGLYVVETTQHAHPGYAHPTFVEMGKRPGAPGTDWPAPSRAVRACSAPSTGRCFARTPRRRVT